MKINSDINILGGLPDWNLVNIFLEGDIHQQAVMEGHHAYTAIKTTRAVNRFKKAIKGTLLSFPNKDVADLVTGFLREESMSSDSTLLLFWNASYNNNLLHYLNQSTYFPAFYSGRISLGMQEVHECLKELQQTNADLKKWGDYTLQKTASKYLTLLKKFGLLEGALNKRLLHPYLNDKMLIIFSYWLVAADQKSNVLQSSWLPYSFSDPGVFSERIMQKKFSKYLNITYTGDKLNIQPLLPYTQLYHVIKQS